MTWNEPSAPTFVVAKNDSTPVAMTVVWLFQPSGRPLTTPWIVEPADSERTRSFRVSPAWRTTSDRLLDFPFRPADAL